jgi:hypothetical protein
MRDLALRTAGVMAILVAIAHGVIAELYVFANARIEPTRTRDLLRMLWQATTLEWIAISALLIAAPAFDSEVARRAIIAVAVVVYGYAAIANAVGTGGRHFGWVAMGGAAVLALIGL